MGEGSYQIVFRGRLAPGAEEAQVKANLAHLFKIDPARVELLFGGGRKVLKQGLNREAADRYRAVLRQAGALVSVVNAETRSAATQQHQPDPKPVSTPNSRAVFAVDDPAATEAAPPPRSKPAKRAVFAVDDPAPSSSATAEPTTEREPAPATLADAGEVESEPASGDDETALLAPPGAQLAEPVTVGAPEISIEGLDLAEVGAIVDDSERPPALELDLGELSVSEDFERLDERPAPPPPDIEVFDLDLADPDAVVDESARPPPPQIDLAGLSLSDDYEALDERPPAPAAEIHTDHLTLEKD